jgi:hypothetical protein
MHRKELNQCSPLRVLEKSIHGGLGRGNLGVVAARTGVGKTAFLVGVALDDLMRSRAVLHVSFDQPLEKVAMFYDDVFYDLSHKQRLADAWKVRRELEMHRRIMCVPDADLTPEKLEETLRFWKRDAEFSPVTIVIDGLEFDSLTVDDLARYKSIARRADAELWMSAVIRREAQRDARGIPQPLADLAPSIDVILMMAHDGEKVQVGLLKDHDNDAVSDLRLALDPTTLLLVEESS